MAGEHEALRVIDRLRGSGVFGAIAFIMLISNILGRDIVVAIRLSRALIQGIGAGNDGLRPQRRHLPLGGGLLRHDAVEVLLEVERIDHHEPRSTPFHLKATTVQFAASIDDRILGTGHEA
jgi:hypothetical protein